MAGSPVFLLCKFEFNDVNISSFFGCWVNWELWNLFLTDNLLAISWQRPPTFPWSERKWMRVKAYLWIAHMFVEPSARWCRLVIISTVVYPQPPYRVKIHYPFLWIWTGYRATSPNLGKGHWFTFNGMGFSCLPVYAGGILHLPAEGRLKQTHSVLGARNLHLQWNPFTNWRNGAKLSVRSVCQLRSI